MTNLAPFLSFTRKHTFFFTLDQRIKFSCDISDSYLYVSWHGKKIRSEMISEAFVQLLTSKNITTKTCSQARHYAFAEVEKVCHIILLTWIEKNRKQRKDVFSALVFWMGFLSSGQYVHFLELSLSGDWTEIDMMWYLLI